MFKEKLKQLAPHLSFWASMALIYTFYTVVQSIFFPGHHPQEILRTLWP